MTSEAANVEQVATGDLIPHPDNPRRGDVSLIAESIETNGWYGTIVAQRSTSHVLAGNHRLLAAQQADIETVPVYWVDVDDAAARRILLADNRTTDLATYDEQALADLLVEMSETGNLDGSGYDGGDLDDLLADLERDDLDADEPPTPAPPDDPITQRGDLILLGNHRLICGDTTDSEVIARLFADGQPAQMIHADPPYGMNKETIEGDNQHGHETPKPVALTERAIRTSSNRGDIIAVPFAGTCPEIIAAENNDRTIYAAELDPGYCDVIVQRWEDHTGGTATRP